MPPEEAISVLERYIREFPGDEEALVVRGQKYWILGRRKEAINDYLAALAINPKSKAKMLLDYSNSILDFYSKDLLNP